ncbi:MAG: cobalamin-dependent protein, partial [Patescibacteria group bacterium]
MKILFLLPNMYLNFGVPHGLATLVAILKKHGHEVEVFDFTFIKTERDTKISSGQIMQKTSTTIYDLVRSDPVENIEEKFAKKLQSFKPDLIGVSATSYTFDMGINLLNKLKSSIDCPVIVGGVHASLAPEDAIKPKIVDFICIGEGEKFIIEFCDCLSKGKDYRDILNLGYKINDKIIINKLRPFVDLDSLPAPDWSAFDER